MNVAIDLPKALTASEERELLNKLESGNVEYAVNKLVEHNLRLAMKVATKYSKPNGVDLDDLFSLAVTGLISAAKSYKKGKSNKFSTYAYPCMENSIRMYLRKNKHTFTDVYYESIIAEDEDGNNISLLSSLTSLTDDYENIENKFMVQKVLELIDTLPETEQQIIKLTYGLIDGIEYKQHEIMKITGYSQPMISKITRRTLKKIKLLLED